MKKILVLFAIVLGLTGCTMNVAPEVGEPTQVEAVGKSTQDAVEEHKDGRRIVWNN